jgi:lipopolysaccharide export system permease protein
MKLADGLARLGLALISAARRTVPAPFGWHTRYMIASYSRHTFLVACAILTLALSIDLTFFLSKVIATVSQWHGFWGASLAWYLVLRGTDFLTELLPLCCFAGVFWTEIVHTMSQERLVVWLSGRALQQCVFPALLFGTAVGVAELALNIYLRPMAVMTLATDQLGFFGEHFDPRPLPYPQWIAAGRDLIQAEVDPGSPPTLREVKVYRMDEALALQTVYRAKLARPVDNHTWILLDGYRWVSPLNSGLNTSGAGTEDFIDAKQEVPFEQEKLDLELAPIWLDNRRIGARYLTNDVFKALARIKFSPDSEFRTWKQARFSMSLFCDAMPLLAATLSTLLLANEVGWAVLCFIAIIGYFANTAMKIFILVGEHGYLSPIAAGWSVPLFLLLVCATIVAFRSRIEAALATFTGRYVPVRS